MMLKQIREVARQYEDQLGLCPLDAHILASIDAGDSVEQISRRLGITTKEVDTILHRMMGRSSKDRGVVDHPA